MKYNGIYSFKFIVKTVVFCLGLVLYAHELFHEAD